MTWFDILKTDSCTRASKRRLYLALEELGANDELLKEVKTAPEDEIVDMMEEFQMEMSGTSHEKLFEELLKTHEKCKIKLMENEKAVMDWDAGQTKLASADILKAKKIDLVLFTDAVNEATSGEKLVFNNDELIMKIRELYKNKLLENGYHAGWVAQHIRHRITPDRVKTRVGRALRKIGWKQGASQGIKVWRR